MTNGTAQSVRDRLLKLSKERGEAFNFVLVRYGLERLLYRLSVSKHTSEFVLKGQALNGVVQASPPRHEGPRPARCRVLGSRSARRRLPRRLCHRGRRGWAYVRSEERRCGPHQGGRRVRRSSHLDDGEAGLGQAPSSSRCRLRRCDHARAHGGRIPDAPRTATSQPPDVCIRGRPSWRRSSTQWCISASPTAA